MLRGQADSPWLADGALPLAEGELTSLLIYMQNEN